MLETGCGVAGADCAHANGREPNLTAVEYKTEFSMWAISASPLQITTRIMNCSAPPQPTCSVSLTKQLSKATCKSGLTFGCGADNSSVWIDGGCRGEFMCNGAPVTCNVNGTGVHTCQCANASPVTCVGWLTDLQKEILLNTEVLACNQDVTPQGTPLHGEGDLTVWARMLSDGSACVAFYNEDDTPASISVNFSELGWSASASASARDLWAHSDLGSFTGRYPATGGVSVPPHGTYMVRLTKA